MYFMGHYALFPCYILIIFIVGCILWYFIKGIQSSYVLTSICTTDFLQLAYEWHGTDSKQNSDDAGFLDPQSSLH